MYLDLFLKRLEEAQAELAKEALTKPQNRDAFEYGRVAGQYAGLEHAKWLLAEIMDEADRKNSDL